MSSDEIELGFIRGQIKICCVCRSILIGPSCGPTLTRRILLFSTTVLLSLPLLLLQPSFPFSFFDFLFHCKYFLIQSLQIN